MLLLLITGGMATAQTKDLYPASFAELEAKIISLDAEAFEAYNTCNLEAFKVYFTNDLEFYHDKGGFSSGIDKLLEGMRNNICNDPNRKVVRKPIDNTFTVYPLDGYGAILTGDHAFYAVENGTEQKTGTAKFTHVWLLKDGAWKMARVLSYDHKSAE